MLTVALITIVKRWKQPTCPSVGKWENKTWSSHAMEYYSAMKRNEVLIYAITQMNLEYIKLSERSQTEKVTYCMIPFI